MLTTCNRNGNLTPKYGEGNLLARYTHNIDNLKEINHVSFKKLYYLQL